MNDHQTNNETTAIKEDHNDVEAKMVETTPSTTTETLQQKETSLSPIEPVSSTSAPQPIPQKRPVGRPRKYPLPTSTSSTTPIITPPPPTAHIKTSTKTKDIEDMFSAGISQRDIQKFILKKKVKKYVSQYLEKFSRQQYKESSIFPQDDEQNQFEINPSSANEDVNEQETSIDVVDEHVDEEDTIVPNSKLGQILGMNKLNRNKLERRSVHRPY